MPDDDTEETEADETEVFHDTGGSPPAFPLVFDATFDGSFN